MCVTKTLTLCGPYGFSDTLYMILIAKVNVAQSLQQLHIASACGIIKIKTSTHNDMQLNNLK